MIKRRGRPSPSSTLIASRNIYDEKGENPWIFLDKGYRYQAKKAFTAALS